MALANAAPSEDISRQILQQEDYIRWLEKHRVDSSDARGALAGLIESLADLKRAGSRRDSGEQGSFEIQM